MSTAPATVPQLLTVREAAERLGICARHLADLTAEGEVICCRFGRAVRYEISELAAYVERSKQRGPVK